jgi:hypothetical protein
MQMVDPAAAKREAWKPSLSLIKRRKRRSRNERKEGKAMQKSQ